MRDDLIVIIFLSHRINERAKVKDIYMSNSKVKVAEDSMYREGYAYIEGIVERNSDIGIRYIANNSGMTANTVLEVIPTQVRGSVEALCRDNSGGINEGDIYLEVDHIKDTFKVTHKSLEDYRQKALLNTPAKSVDKLEAESAVEVQVDDE